MWKRIHVLKFYHSENRTTVTVAVYIGVGCLVQHIDSNRCVRFQQQQQNTDHFTSFVNITNEIFRAPNFLSFQSSSQRLYSFYFFSLENSIPYTAILQQYLKFKKKLNRRQHFSTVLEWRRCLRYNFYFLKTDFV